MDLVLLSGGLDSAVVLAQRAAKGGTLRAVHYSYDHPAEDKEARVASRLADVLAVPMWRRRINPPLSGIMCGTVVGSPVVYGRNLLMLADACALAQSFKVVERVLVGFTAEDRDGFPDCRPEWVEALNAVQAIEGGPRIEAPLMHRTRNEVRELAEFHKVADLAWSCYLPTRDGEPCGECMSCKQ